jgi:HD-like signal output (HDOD) protein
MAFGSSAAGPPRAASGDKPTSESLVGRTLGSFKVTAMLGEGGMGCVYLAEHALIGRKAAIKVLSAGVAGHEEEAAARFFNEARSVAALRHPNIVDVTDFGSFEGKPYLVMEYLEGETLGARLERDGALPEATAARIAQQVAAAAGAAHAQGLVHRDIKPANIFLRQHSDYPDFVKVLDFGIAKLLAADESVSYRTQAGAMLGTPAYMSPEQCLGEATLDHRSDIYSLGVVLYFMVCGRLPFDGQVGRLILGHVHETPKAPVLVNAGVSGVMNAIVLRCLEKRPENRYASMRELRDALGGIAANAAPGAAPVAPVPRDVTPGMGIAVNAATSVGRGAMQASETLRGRLVDIVRGKSASGGIALPPLSPATERCLGLLGNAGFSFGAVAAALSTEPRLASQVVQRANSATFAGRSPATNLERSATRLGAQGLRVALIEIAARPVLEVKGARLEEALRRPFQRALWVAGLAEKLIELRAVAGVEPTDAYLAGLLADAGRPIVATLLLDVERQLANVPGRRWLSEDLWMGCVEATHAPVGAALARQWHLGEAAASGIEAAGSASSRWGLGELLRLSGALATREGHYLRRTDAAAATTVIDGARAFGFDDGALARAVQYVKGKLMMR